MPTQTQLAQTYNDYPQSATNNAKRAIKYKEENGSSCGTQVGWTRAGQLARREKISRSTIARMASFKRHQQNKDVPYSEGCGGLMWDAWGGTSGINWAIRKLKQIDKKTNSKMNTVKKYGFSTDVSESKIDKETGQMFGVSLISVGEALGHDLYVDDDSIDTILQAIDSDNLPAYITHRGALFDDRLTREIGMFTNFRTEEDRLLADFQAFESFREDDSRKFNRLFEMAEKMPERFGLSIVFSATQAWATPGGDVPFGRWPNNDSDRLYDADNPPDDALFEYPSIRVDEVSSADFVDTPAANQKGLFSQSDINQKNKMTKSELIEANEKLAAENEALKAQIEEQDALAKNALETDSSEDETQIESSNTETEDTSVEEDSTQDTQEGESQDEDIASLESVVVEIKEELATQQKENEELKAKLAKVSEDNAKLSSLIKGAKLKKVEAPKDDSWTPSQSEKDREIKAYAKEHNVSEFSATLAIGNKKPELFNANHQ